MDLSEPGPKIYNLDLYLLDIHCHQINFLHTDTEQEI